MALKLEAKRVYAYFLTSDTFWKISYKSGTGMGLKKEKDCNRRSIDYRLIYFRLITDSFNACRAMDS
jgi:hypothetical protein